MFTDKCGKIFSISRTEKQGGGTSYNWQAFRYTAYVVAYLELFIGF